MSSEKRTLESADYTELEVRILANISVWSEPAVVREMVGTVTGRLSPPEPEMQQLRRPGQ